MDDEQSLVVTGDNDAAPTRCCRRCQKRIVNGASHRINGLVTRYRTVQICNDKESFLGEDTNAFLEETCFRIFNIIINRYSFHRITGDSPESFIHLEQSLNIRTGRKRKLSMRNRLL